MRSNIAWTSCSSTGLRVAIGVAFRAGADALPDDAEAALPVTAPGPAYCSSDRKLTRVWNFAGVFCARSLNEGIGGVGLRSVEAIAAGSSLDPT
jgi:hypothetical protein